MASTILADNGVSSGSAGLKSSADSTGVLAFQTTTAGGTATTAVTIDTSQNVGIGVTPTVKLHVASSVAGYTSSLADSVTNAAMLLKTNSSDSTVTSFGGLSGGVGSIQRSNGAGTSSYDIVINPYGGNLGLGVTPSAWNTYKALEIGRVGNYFAGYNGGTEISLGANAYYNSGWKYAITGALATRYMTDNTGGHYWYNAASGTAGNNITFTQAMTLDASGNLLVGTTSVASYIGATTGALANVQSTNGTNTNAFVHSGSSSPYGVFVYYPNAAPNGTINHFLVGQDSSAVRFQMRSNGGLANYSANNANLSDRREKTNFAPAGSYLEKICAIPVQTFNYIDQNLEEDDGLTLGVVAQDVQAVAPELVMESNWAPKDEEPKMRLSIYQTDLQYALMKCIQEQQALITQLTDRITALEAK